MKGEVVMKGKIAILLLLCMLIFTGCSSTCKADGCESERIEGAKYCTEHICAEADCVEGRVGENYCKTHFKCATEYCEDERKLDSQYCVEHSKASTLEEIEIALKELIKNDTVDNIDYSDFSEEFKYWGEFCTVKADLFESSKAFAMLNSGLIVRQLTDENKEVWAKNIEESQIDMQVPEIVVFPIIDLDLYYYMRVLILEGAVLSDGEHKFTSNDIYAEDVDNNTTGIMEQMGSISLYTYPSVNEEDRTSCEAIFNSDNLLRLRLLAYAGTSNIDFSLSQEDTKCIREVFSYYMQLKEKCNTDVVYFGI